MTKIPLQRGTNPGSSGLLPRVVISAKNHRQSPFFELLHNAKLHNVIFIHFCNYYDKSVFIMLICSRKKIFSHFIETYLSLIIKIYIRY